jgi:hypothetical protein
MLRCEREAPAGGGAFCIGATRAAGLPRALELPGCQVRRDQSGALRQNSLPWVGGVCVTREHRAAPITRNPALIWLVTTHPENHEPPMRQRDIL